jgi:ribosomal peptide maturation radical SAM protein 1
MSDYALWPGGEIVNSPTTLNSADGSVRNAADRELPVALVCMPWGSIQRPSLAMAILKQCVRSAGFCPDLHFLNIQFAEMLGLQLYEGFSDLPFHSEWLFSPALFGPQGLGQVQNNWDDLKADPSARQLVEQLYKHSRNSEELCQQIANSYVPKFIDESMSRIDWGRYMAVGFTTTFAQSLSSLLLARKIKEKYPTVKIILGGANVDSDMGVEIMKCCDWVDYVVHGEAENTFPVLLHSIAEDRQEKNIPGVTKRRDKELVAGNQAPGLVVDMNQSPVPDYSDYIHELDRSGFRKKFNLRLYFESSRGCWWGAKHHCTFCGLNGSTMAFRRKDPERVYSEILELAQNYHCLTFAATDNILALEYFVQLLPRLAALDTDMQFFYEVKANLTREQVKLLRASGVREIQPGIESLNSRILKLMRKGTTAIQNIQLLKWCLEYDIEPFWNILYGFPGELPDDYKDYPDFCRLLSHFRPPFNVTAVIFERFSPYFFDKERFGLKLKPIPAYKFIFPESRVDMDKLAYFFDGKWEGQTADPGEYIQFTKDACAAWSKYWTEKSVYCYYSKGPNYIVIHDNRPRAADAPLVARRVELNQEVSAVYLFCDEHRSFQAICEMANQMFGGLVQREQVRSWLDQLVAQGLMFQEADRYLSLAVRKMFDRHFKPRPEPFPVSPA